VLLVLIHVSQGPSLASQVTMLKCFQVIRGGVGSIADAARTVVLKEVFFKMFLLFFFCAQRF
jgi:hypothetical protein